jgi:hypothetical protein
MQTALEIWEPSEGKVQTQQQRQQDHHPWTDMCQYDEAYKPALPSLLPAPIACAVRTATNAPL